MDTVKPLTVAVQNPVLPTANKGIPDWLVLFLLVIFPPVGLIMVFYFKKFHTWIPYIVGIYSVIFFVLNYIFTNTFLEKFAIFYNNLLSSPFPIDVNTTFIIAYFVFFLQLGLSAAIWYQLHFYKNISKLGLWIAALFMLLDFIIYPIICWIIFMQPVANPNLLQNKISQFYNDTTASTEWKAYTSAKMGFSIAYPATWSIENTKLKNNTVKNAYTFAGKEGSITIWQIENKNGLITSGDIHACLPQQILYKGKQIGERIGWQKTQVGQEMLLGCHQIARNEYDSETWLGVDKVYKNNTFLQYSIMIHAPTLSNRELVQKILSSITYQ